MAPNPSAPQPYRHQERDINRILGLIETRGPGYHLLYQLPTGGGKTVVFSELARRFLETFGQRVAILTHRVELCSQTSRTLKAAGVTNRIIDSKSAVPRKQDCRCVVAMVETLKNRIRDKKVTTSDVGLVIIDEAHNNSFHKLLKQFPQAFVVGVTATPLSSDSDKPLNKTYSELVVGESIDSLVSQNFLARPNSVAVPVDLQGLVTGASGDYTIASSDALYGLPAMLQTLLDAYQKYAANKKTLIFNNGIATSLKVQQLFEECGYDIRHLDNRTPEKERRDILKWFQKTKGAILTSVSILTTGFDEPSVQAVILNRATTSLTLYHQMIGRGARWLARKRTFTVVDLGNNADRFGHWNDPLDWQFIFDDPQSFMAQLHSAKASASNKTGMTSEVRALFAKSANVSFDMAEAFLQSDGFHKKAIQNAIRQHALLCLENADSLTNALQLVDALQPDIAFRVREYVKLLDKSTKSYRDWLIDDYTRRLEVLVRRKYKTQEAASAEAPV